MEKWIKNWLKLGVGVYALSQLYNWGFDRGVIQGMHQDKPQEVFSVKRYSTEPKQWIGIKTTDGNTEYFLRNNAGQYEIDDGFETRRKLELEIREIQSKYGNLERRVEVQKSNICID